MKIKKNIAISDSGFIFDPGSGDSFTTNPIGLEIIQFLKEGKSKNQIEAEIIKRYLIDGETFERDYHDFMSVLQKMRLFEENAKEED